MDVSNMPVPLARPGTGGRARRRARCFGIAILVAFRCSFANPPPPAPCEADPAFHRLDFWVGEWDVVDPANGARLGTSVLKKILRGCAISVDWREADGSGEIQETFFYENARKTWRQVWISDAGPTKERRSVDDGPKGSVRFLGEVLQLDGRSHLDRSTVTPLEHGRVRQVIEISRDGGLTWQPAFEGEYRPRSLR
jgi:hypothetical protein